ncbi:MAG: ACT domain-containing protein [Clostridia bacterium]|nr:ACT domain-containing protein [Clostridia bacterium]
MKAIVSVLGKDKIGIIAAVSGTLFKMNINIEDISQTIMQDYFTMIMLVDLSNCEKKLTEVSEILKQKGKELGVSIRIQHEDIFNAMHKL